MQASSEVIAHWRAGDSHRESFDGTEQPAKRWTVQLASMRSDSSSCAVFFFFFLGLDVGEGLGSLLVACAATSTSAKPASSSSTFFFLFLLFTASSRVATRALASLRSFSRFDFWWSKSGTGARAARRLRVFPRRSLYKCLLRYYNIIPPFIFLSTLRV